MSEMSKKMINAEKLKEKIIDLQSECVTESGIYREAHDLYSMVIEIIDEFVQEANQRHEEVVKEMAIRFAEYWAAESTQLDSPYIDAKHAYKDYADWYNHQHKSDD